MAKPTELAPWADDANYPAGAEPEAGTPTKVAYTLGQATVGWRPGGRPPAQELNTWMHRVGLWVAYIDAGEWDDDLHVTGNLIVDGNISSTGGTTEVANDVAVGGDVDVAETLQAAALYYEVAVPVVIPGSRVIDPTASHTAVNAGSGARVGTLLGGSGNPLQFPIDGLRENDVITAYDVVFDKTSGLLGTFQGLLKSYENVGPEANESPGTGILNFGGGVGYGLLSESGLDILVTPTKQYYLFVDPSAGSSNDVVYHAIVHVARPRPAP